VYVVAANSDAVQLDLFGSADTNVTLNAVTQAVDFAWRSGFGRSCRSLEFPSVYNGTSFVSLPADIVVMVSQICSLENANNCTVDGKAQTFSILAHVRFP
jgi:hypothetical protein